MLRYIPDNIGFKTNLIVQSENSLRVGIIDADLLDHGTRHPNLTFLKISAFCKNNGHHVRLIMNYDELRKEGKPAIIDCNYDILVLSKVFKFTNIPDFITQMLDEHLIY